MLYQFDAVDDRLELLPLSARRALDHAGRKLSREGWSSLPIAARRQIVELGAARIVDVEHVQKATALARPKPEHVPMVGDPPSDAVPEEVRRALGPERPVSDAVWSALGALDRYALFKVATRSQPERIAAAYAEIVGQSAVSTHVAPGGGARMVDVGEKAETRRRAVSRSEVTMSAAAFEKLRGADVAKGDVLGTARLAGIMAAKRTPELIPLCHPIAISKVTVEFELDPPTRSVRITATVEAVDRTGVEMESLVAATVAGLTIYDMLKSTDRAMALGPSRLLEKSGGRSGEFRG